MAYTTPPLVFNPENVMVPEAVIAAILTKLPDASMRWVPADAPVLMPVVPFTVVPVMVFAVAMVPKPDAIEPDVNAPTVVNDEVVTVVPRVVEERTSLLLIWKVLPDAKLKVLSELTRLLPPLAERVIVPVVAPPMVRLCLEVVCNVPSAVK